MAPPQAVTANFSVVGLDCAILIWYNQVADRGKVMKKRLAVCLLCVLGLCLTGCGSPRQFEISLKDGLFQGTASRDPAWTVSVELSEMDRVEYIKTNKNKVKDLSTIDTKFYTAYHIDLVLSEGNENYVVEFSEAVAQDHDTTDTYALKDIGGDGYDRKFDLSDVTLQLIDHDGDRAADELKINYKLGGASDSADLKWIAVGAESPIPHHNFLYQCNLTFDENIQFDLKSDDTFAAGTELFYYVYQLDGYKVIMDVNGEPYAELASSENKLLRFGYVTGYRDVSIRFRAVKID